MAARATGGVGSPASDFTCVSHPAHTHIAVAARSLSLHIQAVLQGGFILAKAKGEAGVARDSIAHLKRYFEMLFKDVKVKES